MDIHLLLTLESSRLLACKPENKESIVCLFVFFTNCVELVILLTYQCAYTYKCPHI